MLLSCEVEEMSGLQEDIEIFDKEKEYAIPDTSMFNDIEFFVKSLKCPDYDLDVFRGRDSVVYVKIQLYRCNKTTDDIEFMPDIVRDAILKNHIRCGFYYILIVANKERGSITKNYSSLQNTKNKFNCY
jgi:hypothetical protein